MCVTFIALPRAMPLAQACRYVTQVETKGRLASCKHHGRQGRASVSWVLLAMGGVREHGASKRATKGMNQTTSSALHVRPDQ